MIYIGICSRGSSRFIYFFFFFQAEDGIRDLTVTGVQTCALPIFHEPSSFCCCTSHAAALAIAGSPASAAAIKPIKPHAVCEGVLFPCPFVAEIGRASCRERV